MTTEPYCDGIGGGRIRGEVEGKGKNDGNVGCKSVGALMRGYCTGRASVSPTHCTQYTPAAAG